MTTMKKHRAFSPDHEIQVHFLDSMKEAISRSESSEKFSELYAKAGLLGKKPDDWVPAQTMLDICNELEERSEVALDFVATGVQISLNATFPSEFTDLPLEQKLASVGEGYAHFNRGTDIGYSRGEVVAPQHLVFHLRTPWPADMTIGVFQGICKRFLPPQYGFEVYYDEGSPRLDQAGKETLIHVAWELKKAE